jgi:hypothetical protein
MVNEKFNGQQPILSPEASLAAAKKLYRHAMGTSWKGSWKLTSGRRATWVRYGVFYVNPDERRASGRGLREIIHSISHYCHRRLHPGDKPHSIRQARLEAKLAKFAVDRNCWQDVAPVVQTEKAKPDAVRQRYQRMVNRRDKWAKTLEQAKRLHAKADREVRAYERRHGGRVLAE